MQVIQLTRYGKPEEGLRPATIAEPDRPSSGQMLIRVEYAPINDSDLLLASGLYPVQPKPPTVVGNEGAGKVLDVGHDVQNVQIGDRRDYAAAEKFWSPHYIQHSAHIGQRQ